MRVEFQITGAAELEQNLRTLGARVEKNVVRRAVRAAQRPVLASCQQAARSLPKAERRLFVAGKGGQEDIRMSELIARSLEIAAPKRQQPGSYSLHVQLARNVPEFRHRSKAGVETYIPAAIEFGHGASPETAARPFMRPGAERAVDESKRVLENELRLGILREAIRGRLR